MRRSCYRHIILRFSLMLLLPVAFGLPVLVWGSTGTVIILRPTAMVEGQEILLGDLAEIQPAHDPHVPKLLKIKIANAPLPGQSRWIHGEEIKQHLKQFGLSEEGFTLRGAATVKVSRRATVVSASRINEAVKDFIRRKAPWHSNQLKIRRLTYHEALTIPAGKVRLVVSPPLHTDWLGPVPFSVQVLVDGRAVSRITAPATIEVWSNVVLAAKPLGKYQPIDADDIKVEKANLSRMPANAILDPNMVLGRRTNRNIAANCVLRSDQVEMPPVVKRGDVVQMVAESSLLRVEARGVVRENGAVGDRIQVMNLSSKKIIYAQVKDGQTVEVHF
jgi:flagellar basal body P-ring formation protein FlgA